MRRISILVLYFILVAWLAGLSSLVSDAHADPSPPSWARWYNEGTQRLQEGKVAEGLAYLDAARTLRPWDASIRQNYRLSEQAWLASAGPSPERDPAANLAEMADQWVPLGAVEIVCVLVALFFFPSAYRRWKRRAYRHIPKAFLASLIIVLLIECVRLFPGVRAVAWVKQSTELRSGPGEDFAPLTTVAPPVRLRVTGQNSEGTWLQLAFATDRVAWAPVDAVLHLAAETEKNSAR